MEADTLKLLARSAQPIDEVVADAGGSGLRLRLDGPGALGDRPDVVLAVLTQRLLALRGRHPVAFGAHAGYLPIEVTGPLADRTIAYARTDAEGTPLVAVVVAPFAASVGERASTRVGLPGTRWRHVLDDDPRGSWYTLSFADVFPVTVLERPAAAGAPEASPGSLEMSVSDQDR